MALSPGARLGVYEIGAQIGVGGMGEVYRATDTNLKRDVAIKVLPEAVAADAERLARFRREAEVLASLNHPHIAQIYGLERSDGQNALVMELVEGPTLADLITSSRLAVTDAMAIARQIADALEAAHDRGIIHRDLKPANVKVRPDGTVKVLDFGLAKAMETTGAMSSSASMSPTITTPAMTQAGLILGTAAYMSPEQAKGRVVDRRADIWAFGCVLFEMLSGTRAFAGEDVSDTLASVLKSDANWGELPATVPERVRQVIRLCLQKDARQRIDSIRDVRLALDGAFETTAIGPAIPASAPSLRFWQRPVPALAAAVVFLVLGGLAAVFLTRAPAEPRQVARFSIPLGDQAFAFIGRHNVAMSPDGSTIAYTADNSLWLRPIDSLPATQVRGTETEARSPFFSPDGQWVGYFAGAQLRKVSVTGGAPTMICDDVTNPFGVSWGDDDVILFGQMDGIWKVAGDGGRPQKVIATEGGEQAHGPQLLPGGEWVLFTLRPSGNVSWESAQIVTQSLTTGVREVVFEGGRDARYLDTGHLVYGLGGVLLAVPFDLATRRGTGGRVPLIEGVRAASPAPVNSGAVQFAVADNGTLIYVPGAVSDTELRSLVWVSADGKEAATLVPARTYAALSLSPDGTRAALEIDDETDDIWVAHLSGGGLVRLTTDPAMDESPLWSTDGTRVIFSSMRSGRPELYSKAPDGTGVEERVATFEEGITTVRPKGWSADGRLLVQYTRGSSFPDVGLVAVDGSSTLEPLLQTQAAETQPTISPDGRSIAYASNETGTPELYVQPFPELGPRQQLSVVGSNSHSPTWSDNSRTLFYLEGGPPRDVMRVAVERLNPPEQILDYLYYARLGGHRLYDVSRQDGRFLMIRGTDSTLSNEITVVLNWVEELKARVQVR